MENKSPLLSFTTGSRRIFSFGSGMGSAFVPQHCLKKWAQSGWLKGSEMCSLVPLEASAGPPSLWRLWRSSLFSSSCGGVVTKSCLTLCGPMDCSPPGPPVCGILQARALEGAPVPSPRDLPDAGIEPLPPALARGSFLLCDLGSPAINKQPWSNVLSS